MQSLIIEHLQASIDVKTRILEDESLLALVEQVATAIINAYQGGKKVLICGNGGSAADAQHIAAEFAGKFYKERAALPALGITREYLRVNCNWERLRVRVRICPAS